jgi:hypothetical protein
MVGIAHAHPNLMFNAVFSRDDVSQALAFHSRDAIQRSVLLYRLFGLGPIKAKVLDPVEIKR